MLPLSRPAARPAAASRSARPGLKVLRRACAVAAVALIPVLAGCEAGGDAPVLHWHPPTNGASATITAGGGEIAIRNAFILGGRRPTSPCRRAVRRACSWGWSIRARGTAWSGSPRRAPRLRSRCPRAASCWRGITSALLTGPAPELVLSGLTRSLVSGSYVRVLFTFQKAGTVTLTLPVIDRADSYATFSPAPTPTPSASATGKRRHRGQATPTPTAGGTATATPTATPTA